MSGPRKLRVLALGPVRGMLTGQRLAFLNYVDNSIHELRVVDIGSDGLKSWLKVVYTLAAVGQALFEMFVCKPDRIYITTSRSLLGFLKDIVVLLAARILRIPVVNHLHGNGFESFRKQLPRALRFLLDLSYRAIPVSIVLADRMGYHYAAYRSWMKVVAVSNCSEMYLDDFPGLKSQGEAPLRVLYLSNLFRKKGILDFVRGVKQASMDPAVPAFDVQILGGYAHNTPSEVTPAELEAELVGVPRVAVIGAVNGDAKWRSLAWADVLIFTSCDPGEAAPLSVIEAISMGCMVASTPIGYVPELLSGTCHLVLRSQDPSSVAETISFLAANRDKVLEARTINLRMAKERFSLPRYVEQIDRVVAQLSELQP